MTKKEFKSLMTNKIKQSADCFEKPKKTTNNQGE